MLSIKRIAQLSCLLLPLSASTLVFANTLGYDTPAPAQGMPAPSMHGDNMDKRLQRLSKELNLSKEQQQQISQQLNKTKSDMQRYMDQMHKSEQQLNQTMAQGNFDNGTIKKAASEGADAFQQMAMLRAQSTKIIYDALTPEQQQQFRNMLQKRASKMQQYGSQRGHGHGPDRMQPMPPMED